MPSSASLEIHFINVSQGDSILIVNRDQDALRAAVDRAPASAGAPPDDPMDFVPWAVREGVDLYGTVERALLIDGGDDVYGGDVVWYMETQGVMEARHGEADQQAGVPDPGRNRFVPNLAVLVSHFHDDHVAGLRSVFRQRVRRTAQGVLLDRDGRRVVGETWPLEDRYRPARVYLTAPDDAVDPGSARLANLRDDIEAASTLHQESTEVVHVDPGGLVGGEQLVIDLGAGADGVPITLTAFAASRAVYDPAGPGARAVDSDKSPREQNARSIALVLEYGSFRCYLGGDLPGTEGAGGGNTGANASGSGDGYADVEGPLNAVLRACLPATDEPGAGEAKFRDAGHCTVVKANHHGSSSSNNVHMLATVRPRVVVLSAGVRTHFYSHPTQQVVNRTDAVRSGQWATPGGNPAQVDNSVDGVYVTEVGARVNGQDFTVDLRGTNVLGDVVVRPTDESVAAVRDAVDFGTELRVQVYGTGEQTGTLPDGTALRPVFAPQDQTPPYVIGPFWHTSSRH